MSARSTSSFPRAVPNVMDSSTTGMAPFPSTLPSRPVPVKCLAKLALGIPVWDGDTWLFNLGAKPPARSRAFRSAWCAWGSQCPIQNRIDPPVWPRLRAAPGLHDAHGDTPLTFAGPLSALTNNQLRIPRLRQQPPGRVEGSSRTRKSRNCYQVRELNAGGMSGSPKGHDSGHFAPRVFGAS
jgi:hypothetical protein